MPAAAGVAYSYNAYRWDPSIDPKQGMVRIVMGLGTRAVDRTEGDYPRIAALDRPGLRPFGGAEPSRHAQHKVDVLDFGQNRLATLGVAEAQGKMKGWFRALMVERDFARERDLRERGHDVKVAYTTCERLLSREDFVGCLRGILRALEEEYRYPVDVEFAVNFSEAGDFRINLLQCRPLQVRGGGRQVRVPELPEKDTWFRLRGGTMGMGGVQAVDLAVVVDPHAYHECPYHRKPAVARLVGMVNQQLRGSGKVAMLLAPGRLGTTSPELGVAVRFSEICYMGIVCEVASETAGFMPELSFGSHFFQDLVEANIFYASIMESKGSTAFYNPGFLSGLPSATRALCPDADDDAPVGIVKAYDVSGLGLRFASDVQTGEALCGIF
jgi:hypothetical protein